MTEYWATAENANNRQWANIHRCELSTTLISFHLQFEAQFSATDFFPAPLQFSFFSSDLKKCISYISPLATFLLLHFVEKGQQISRSSPNGPKRVVQECSRMPITSHHNIIISQNVLQPHFIICCIPIYRDVNIFSCPLTRSLIVCWLAPRLSTNERNSFIKIQLVHNFCSKEGEKTIMQPLCRRQKNDRANSVQNWLKND